MLLNYRREKKCAKNVNETSMDQPRYNSIFIRKMKINIVMNK